MSTEDICEVVITGPSADWLADFTRKLVDSRLAACGQNISPIRSIYRWQGTVEDESEARVCLHSRVALVPLIVARADQEHPYAVPCVIAFPVIASNPAYARWVLESTDPA